MRATADGLDVAGCPFCDIVRTRAPARRVDEGVSWVAFHDVAPQAPVHILIVPRRHVDRLSEMTDSTVLGGLLTAAARIGGAVGPHGYRVVVNEDEEGHQTVSHLHLHVLAGRRLAWPPG